MKQRITTLLLSLLLALSFVACDDGSLPSDETISPIPTPIPGGDENGSEGGFGQGTGSGASPENTADAGSTEDIVDSEDVDQADEDTE
jgi:hypothetical protein